MFPSYPKDPDDEKDFSIDWRKWIKTDIIKSSAWFVPDGITKLSDSFDVSFTHIWLAGGTAGHEYNLLNRIATWGGRIEDQTIVIRVAER